MADGASHDLKTLLSSESRDFLVRNGIQVKIADLTAKIIGLYFSGSWCGPCRRFTQLLIEPYEVLSLRGDFEVVFLSSDKDEESFRDYFAKMPWPAIPFSDSVTITSLRNLFEVNSEPHLVVLDSTGKVLTDQGFRLIKDYGVDAYPFTAERIHSLKEEEKAARKNQSLSSLLVSPSRNYLISNDGIKVPVSELEGSIVGLYFYVHLLDSCLEFSPKLVHVYEELKERGEKFEVVVIPLDSEESDFERGFKTMPWVALPFHVQSCHRLARHFELSTLPGLAIIGPDGKTLHPNVVELIEDHGVEAYPFTPEKRAELAEITRAKNAGQTLESVLVSEGRDFVIDQEGSKISVSDLVGKNILLYFSAHWCPPCRTFLPKLLKAYKEIKAKDDAFEVIFISSDRDQSSFDSYFASMPWLALPFGDPRKVFLLKKFRIKGIPAAVALNSGGQTVTKEVRELITAHGPAAYPFTEEHLKRLESSEL